MRMKIITGILLAVLFLTGANAVAICDCPARCAADPAACATLA